MHRVKNLKSKVMSEVKQAFAPEFINRLDETIIFDELTDTDLAAIIDLQIRRT
jgi:ATP-dependent Clp protease ATP-binding subunit ClpA